MSQTGHVYHRSLFMGAVLLATTAGMPASLPVAVTGECFGSHAVPDEMPTVIMNGQIPRIAATGTAGQALAKAGTDELAISRRRLCRLNGRSQWCEFFIERYASRVRLIDTLTFAGTGDFAAIGKAGRA